MKTALIFLAAMTAALALANGYLIYAKYDADAKLVEDDTLMLNATIMLKLLNSEVVVLRAQHISCKPERSI
jgi:hypothetical protein